MRHILLIILCAAILSMSSQCENEAVSQNGHLKLTVMYPEVIIESDTVYWIQVPGVGAEVRLYDKDAICLGYKDAKLNLVMIGDEYSMSDYLLVTDENGEVLFKDIPAEEYFLIVYARLRSTYTEKYIELSGGDTLKLTKIFSPSAKFYEDLEPWDYEVPVN